MLSIMHKLLIKLKINFKSGFLVFPGVMVVTLEALKVEVLGSVELSALCVMMKPMADNNVRTLIQIQYQHELDV